MGKFFIGDKEVSPILTDNRGEVEIIDNLESTKKDAALSANQGRVLNETKQNILTPQEGIFLEEDKIGVKKATEEAIGGVTVDGVSIKVEDGQISTVEPFKPYSRLEYLTDYLYEIYYSHLDYDFAEHYFEQNTIPLNLGCSTIRKNEFLAKNNDWVYNEMAEFVVKTEHADDRFQTLGVASGIPKLTNDIVKNKEPNILYKIVPFSITDGINEKGLAISVNVVPKEKGVNTFIPAKITEKYKLNVRMLSRFILDNFANINDMISYLPNYVTIWAKDNAEYDLHFMVADNEKTCVIEFIKGQIVFLTENQPFMTNFHLSGTIFNDDGSVLTPETQTEQQKPTIINKITPHGQGLERYNLINTNYNSLQDFETLNNFMKELLYTRSYDTAEHSSNPYWYTELVDDNLTIDSKITNYATKKTKAGEMYLRRSRIEGTENYGTWQTTHTSIYNLENLQLSISPQESGHHFLFTIDKHDSNIQVDNETIKINANNEIYAVKATNEEYGIVKPDGTTTKINEDGTLSSVGGGTIYTQGDGIAISPTNVLSTRIDLNTMEYKNGAIAAKIIEHVPVKSVVNENGLNLDDTGKLSLSKATSNNLGTIKPDGITTHVDENGILSAEAKDKFPALADYTVEDDGQDIIDPTNTKFKTLSFLLDYIKNSMFITRQTNIKVYATEEQTLTNNLDFSEIEGVSNSVSQRSQLNIRSYSEDLRFVAVNGDKPLVYHNSSNLSVNLSGMTLVAGQDIKTLIQVTNSNLSLSSMSPTQRLSIIDESKYLHDEYIRADKNAHIVLDGYLRIGSRDTITNFINIDCATCVASLKKIDHDRENDPVTTLFNINNRSCCSLSTDRGRFKVDNVQNTATITNASLLSITDVDSHTFWGGTAVINVGQDSWYYATDGLIKPIPIATTDKLGWVKPDGNTVKIDDEGKLTAVTSGTEYTNGAGIDISDTHVISTKTDGITIKTNDNQELTAIDQSIIQNVDATNGLNLTDKKLSLNKATADQLGTVKPDNSTIQINEDGALTAVLSEGLIKNVTKEHGLNLSDDGTLSLDLATSSTSGTVIPDNDTITINNGVISAVGGGSGIDVAPGTGIDISKEGNVATISAKIGTNSDLGIIKADGVSVFLDPDGTLSSKTTLADIQSGDGIDITYGTGHDLPEEYVELVFVRGKAGCHLDTGINADSNTAFEVTAQRLANPSESFNVFGAAKTGAVSGVQFLNNNNARSFVGTYSTEYTPTTTNVFFDTIVFYGDVTKRTIRNKATGETVQNTKIYTTQFDVGKNYYIGRINGLTSGADFTGRIFEVKIWQYNNLVRDYIPAKKRDTQEIGFYDLVNGEFSKATTSAQFIEGPDAVPSTVISSKAFVGATETSSGLLGAVPAPTSNDINACLKGDGTWGNTYKEIAPFNFYIDNINGVDDFTSHRGFSADYAFKTVQGALDCIALKYKIGQSNCSLVISGYTDNVIEQLQIPFIESDGGAITIRNPVTIITTNADPCLIINNNTKIVLREITFKTLNNLLAQKLVVLNNANITLEGCSFINESNKTLLQAIDINQSVLNISNITFECIQDGQFQNLISSNLSEIVHNGFIHLTNIKMNFGYRLNRSHFYYEGEGEVYPEGSISWKPFDITTSALYLPKIAYTSFFYDSAHKGQQDKLSTIYDMNGIVENITNNEVIFRKW